MNIKVHCAWPLLMFSDSICPDTAPDKRISRIPSVKMRGLSPAFCTWHKNVCPFLDTLLLSGRKFPFATVSLLMPVYGGDLQSVVWLTPQSRWLLFHLASHLEHLYSAHANTSSSSALHSVFCPSNMTKCTNLQDTIVQSLSYYLYSTTLTHTQVI